MTIVVSGHQIDISQDDRVAYVEDIRAIVERHQAGMTSAHVIFGRGPHDRGTTCQITGHFPKNTTLHASGESSEEDTRLAFTQALGRLTTQVLRQTKARVPHLRLVNNDS